MKLVKRNYTKLEETIKTIQLRGYEYIGMGKATYKGYWIDLSATEPTHLAIAYETLRQLDVKNKNK